MRVTDSMGGGDHKSIAVDLFGSGSGCGMGPVPHSPSSKSSTPDQPCLESGGLRRCLEFTCRVHGGVMKAKVGISTEGVQIMNLYIPVVL